MPKKHKPDKSHPWNQTVNLEVARKLTKPKQHFGNGHEALTSNQVNLLRRLGLSWEHISELQRSIYCGLCGKQSNELVVDHDHNTNEFRALLCSKCNTGLGQFNDDPKQLFRAMQYLRRHGK